MIKKFFSLLALLCLLPTLTQQTLAATTSNSDYILHLHVNTVDDLLNLNPKPPTTPTPQPTPILVNTINIGYNKQPLTDFSFAISQDAINFGPLSPTDFIIRDTILTIKGDPSYAYSMLVSEDGPLTSTKNHQVIPNTSCDNALCSETVASSWTNTLTYGFGYRCDNLQGNDCSLDFSQSDFYKQFADESIHKEPQVVMSGTTGTTKKTKVTYKLNIAGTQPQGTYQNRLTFIAVPNF